MKRGALGRGDDVSGGPRPRHLGHLDFARYAERRRDLRHRRARLRRHSVAEISAGDGDPQAVGAARESDSVGSTGRCAHNGIVGIGPLHGVVARREVGDGARERPEMIEARHEGKARGARQPAIGRLQPEDAAQRGRHPDRAVGVGAERERHHAAPPPRRPSRPRSRRSSATCRAGCARGRRGRSRR